MAQRHSACKIKLLAVILGGHSLRPTQMAAPVREPTQGSTFEQVAQQQQQEPKPSPKLFYARHTQRGANYPCVERAAEGPKDIWFTYFKELQVVGSGPSLRLASRSALRTKLRFAAAANVSRCMPISQAETLGGHQAMLRILCHLKCIHSQENNSLRGENPRLMVS